MKDHQQERPEMTEKTAPRKGNILIDIAVAAVMLFGLVLYGIYSLIASVISRIFGLF